CFSVGNDLHQALSFIGSQGTATGNKGESTYVVGLTRCFHLLFGFTNCSNFGVGVDNVWNDVVVHHSLLASNALSDHHTFFRPFVCQHRAAHNVTDSPDTRRIGRAQVINVDEATLIQVHATVSSQQTFGVWTTTHAHDQFVEGFFLLFAIFVSVRDRKSTRLNSSHVKISYAVFCLKKKKPQT